MLHTFILKGPTQSGRSTLLRGMCREISRMTPSYSARIVVPTRMHAADLRKRHHNIAYMALSELTIEAIRAATFIGIDLDDEINTFVTSLRIQEIRATDVLQQLVVVSHSDWKSI